MQFKFETGMSNDEPFQRFEFETFEDLETYFLSECWGKKGLRTKVIGTVLLIQERKE